MLLRENVKLVTKLFFKYCMHESIYWGGKFNPDYFKIRAFFNKQDNITIECLIEYLMSLEQKQIMTISELFKNAKEYIQQKQQAYIREQTKMFKEKNTKEYKEITVEDVLNL
jgi:hypothetical protein